MQTLHRFSVSLYLLLSMSDLHLYKRCLSVVQALPLSCTSVASQLYKRRPSLVQVLPSACTSGKWMQTNNPQTTPADEPDDLSKKTPCNLPGNLHDGILIYIDNI